jgi:hypothetical protein
VDEQGRGAAVDVVLEVVTYDPLRRLGFMRIVEGVGGGRVHFALGMLPEAFKRPRVERSRPLNDRTLPREAFQALMRELAHDLVGRRFRGRIRSRPDGRWSVAARTLAQVGE